MAVCGGPLRVFSGVLLLIILLQSVWILSGDPHSYAFAPPPPPPPPPLRLDPLPPGTWQYDPRRDAKNPGLNEAQCAHAFPKLYYEIDRAVAYWQKAGSKITVEDTDIEWRNDAAMRLLIHENEIRILNFKGAWFKNHYRERTMYSLLQIYRALEGAKAAGEILPTIEFPIVVDDMSLVPDKPGDTHSIWAYARRLDDRVQDRLWLMPDFNFYAFPPVQNSYTEMQRRAKFYDSDLSAKLPQLGWRGVKWTNEYVRGHLLDVTRGKDWADVVEIKWDDEKSKTDILRMEDMCRYRYVAHTEGRSWSGRLKFLLNCDSLPFVHDLEWTAAYYHLLIPDGPEQNHVHVKRDWSDLESKISYYTKHPDVAQRVADNSVRTFRQRYTSPAAEACYWRELVRGWSKVAFVPKPFETVTVDVAGSKVQKRQLRGTPFEEFIYIPNDDE